MDKDGFWGKLKNFKHLQIAVCVAVLIVVLIVYFACASCSTEKTANVANTDDDLFGGGYCENMQKQVENIVSKISGVGSASVVINWDKSTDKSAFGSGTTENPKPIGALIVCDGGGSTKVKLDVIYAVSTLLDLSIEKIMVYPKSG